MSARIFLAGASGAIGRRLVPMLGDAGYVVGGMTRSPEKAERLRSLGAEPVVVDVYDVPALTAAVQSFRPDIVIHQLTDLQHIRDPSRRDEVLARNARIRTEGTRNLVQAALAAGARRMIAQSIAWVYAPGPTPHAEDDPLDVAATKTSAATIAGVVALEEQVLRSLRLRGIVLRYGYIYGPGTGTETPLGSPPLHVDGAARAALLAVQHDVTGIFNIAEPNDLVATDKARAVLGW